MRFEKEFGEILKEVFGDLLTFTSQFRVLQYKIDWYISELNLAIEFDEPLHDLVADETRQRIIQKELKCEFLRIKQKQELQGLKQLIKIVINKYINYSKI